MKEQPLIASVGLCCPLGEDFLTATAAYAQGKRSFKRQNAWVAADGLAPILSCVIAPEAEQNYILRLRYMFDRAYLDCLRGVESLQNIRARKVRMILILPKWMEETPHFKLLRQAFGESPLDSVSKIDVLFGEESESLEALRIAHVLIAAGDEEAVLVTALDSFIDPTLLDKLAYEKLMFLTKVSHGFIPGEACASILVTASRFAPRSQAVRFAVTAAQESPSDPDEPPSIRGRGLAEALRRISDSFSDMKPVRVLSNLNGLRWRAEEYGFAVARIGTLLGDDIHDPECHSTQMGELGAATGAVMVALAVGPQLHDRKQVEDVDAPKYPTLIVSSSASGLCCAMALTQVHAEAAL